MKILVISKYQKNVDYSAAAADIDGVILRAGLRYWGTQKLAEDEGFALDNGSY